MNGSSPVTFLFELTRIDLPCCLPQLSISENEYNRYRTSDNDKVVAKMEEITRKIQKSVVRGAPDFHIERPERKRLQAIGYERQADPSIISSAAFTEVCAKQYAIA